KLLHLAEEAFPLATRGGSGVMIGRWNFKPKRWHLSPCVRRTRRALRVRMECAKLEAGGRGATGISRARLADLGRLRRVARRMPPALIFKAVANSRKSRPSCSTPRTNTGMDRGRRGYLRRSGPVFAMTVPRFLAHTT